MAEFEIGGKKYRSSKMNAFDQLHVMRKLAPIFTAVGSLSEIVASVKGADGSSDAEGAEAKGKAGGAVSVIAKAVAEMSETDLNAVLAKCCSVTSREVGSAGYAPIWSAGAGRLMYDDIEWLDLIQITANVISDNIGNFSAAPLSNFRG